MLLNYLFTILKLVRTSYDKKINSYNNNYTTFAGNMLAKRICHLLKRNKHVTIDSLSGISSRPVLGDIYFGYIFIEDVLS